MRFPFVCAAVTLAALAFISSTPQAGMVASLGSVTSEAGGFRFSYNVFFDGLDASPAVTITLEPNDFFTIYDFVSLVPSTNLEPVNWTFSSSLTGANPSGLTPPDDPAVPNLTWNIYGCFPHNGWQPGCLQRGFTRDGYSLGYLRCAKHADH